METAEETELVLTFLVPETDFDMITLEVGLKALERRLRQPQNGAMQSDEDNALFSAYHVLWTIHARYAETLGEPDWKLPYYDMREFEGFRLDALCGNTDWRRG